MKALAAPFALLLVLVGIYLLLDRTTPPPAELTEPLPAAALPMPATPVVTRPPPAVEPTEVLDLTSELNASDRTIRDDLRLLDGVFSVWQTNFLREGNPTGDNAEITRALIGDNPLRVAFIPPDHPAINAQGELCDRWGTPFFFHQLSGFHLEIVSAGPDRRRGTLDDAIIASGNAL